MHNKTNSPPLLFLLASKHLWATSRSCTNIPHSPIFEVLLPFWLQRGTQKLPWIRSQIPWLLTWSTTKGWGTVQEWSQVSICVDIFNSRHFFSPLRNAIIIIIRSKCYGLWMEYFSSLWSWMGPLWSGIRFAKCINRLIRTTIQIPHIYPHILWYRYKFRYTYLCIGIRHIIKRRI